MHILVTGGCGYKGSVLTQMLLEKGYQVTVIDSMWFGNHFSENISASIGRIDIRKAKFLPKADAMIHLAAVANDPAALLDSRLTWEVNTLATNQLLDLCVKVGIPQFIYASSGSVYGIKPDGVEVTEEQELVPLSDYNKTKQIAERVVSSYNNKMNTTIIRPATVCGVSPRQRLDVAVNALTYDALAKGKITLHGGDQVRPNVHIKDICNTYIWCLENPSIVNGQIYNVGFENLSLRSLAVMIQAQVSAHMGREVEIDWREDVTDPRSYRLNSDKILSAGFEPKLKVLDGVHDMIDAYKAGEFEKRNIDQCYNMKWMTECKIK